MSRDKGEFPEQRFIRGYRFKISCSISLNPRAGVYRRFAWIIGRFRFFNALISPSACALINRPKLIFIVGMSKSIEYSRSRTRKWPFCVPPLNYCPVECRYRGPKPRSTTIPYFSVIASPSAARRSATRLSRSVKHKIAR